MHGNATSSEAGNSLNLYSMFMHTYGMRFKICSYLQDAILSMGAAMIPTEFTAAAKQCLHFTLPSMVGSILLDCVIIWKQAYVLLGSSGCVCLL